MELKKLQYNEMDEEKEGSGKDVVVDKNMSILSDVNVDISVSLGKATLTISELYDLKVGDVIELDAHVDSEVIIQLSGNTIATGVLSVVDDNYAVEITKTFEQSV